MTVFPDGIGCMLGGAFFATKLPIIRRFVYPIYVMKGIIPEVATGLQSASSVPQEQASHDER